MSPTTEDLRRSLELMAEASATPDAHTLLTGASARVEELDRQRRSARLTGLGAVAAVAAGAFAMSTIGSDQALEVEPAVPDPAYTQGYGWVDGAPASYTQDGLRLVESVTIDRDGGAQLLGWETSEEVQTYAAAWCAPAGVLVEVRVGDVSQQVACADPATDNSQVGPLAPLPPGTGDVSAQHADSGASSPATVVFYEEVAWSQFPFPARTSTAWSETQGRGVVIDDRTPQVEDSQIAELTGVTEAPTVTVPVDDATPLVIQGSLLTPGQLLIAIDGVVVTNDGEELNRVGPARPGPWESATPRFRTGFFHSFADGGQSFRQLYDAQSLAELGVDISDGQVRISAVPRGVAEDAWRVQVETVGETASLQAPVAQEADDETFPEQAVGLERLGVYAVPMNGTPVRLPVEGRTDLTLLARCDTDEQTPPSLKVSTPDDGAQLRCFPHDVDPGDRQWDLALEGVGVGTVEPPGLTVRAPSLGGPAAHVAVYGPVP
jgi:hypothetical protein